MDDAAIRPALTVGVDGSRASLRAVDFAAAEAHRRDWGVRLVHALPDLRSADGYDDRVQLGLHVSAQRHLDAAVRHARRICPLLQIRPVVSTGQPLGVLLDEAARATMVVLGRNRVEDSWWSPQHSLATEMAAMGHSPVVSVGRGHHGLHPRGRVVVGVDGTAESESVLGTAFAIAATRRARLTVVRSSDVPGSWRWGPLSRDTHDEDWIAEAREHMQEQVGRWLARFPDVRVSRVLELSSNAAEALVRRSSHASLMIVGAHGPRPEESSGLGTTTRRVLAGSACAVMVVPAALPAEPALLHPHRIPQQRGGGHDRHHHGLVAGPGEDTTFLGDTGT